MVEKFNELYIKLMGYSDTKELVFPVDWYEKRTKIIPDVMQFSIMVGISDVDTIDFFSNAAAKQVASIAMETIDYKFTVVAGGTRLEDAWISCLDVGDAQNTVLFCGKSMM